MRLVKVYSLGIIVSWFPFMLHQSLELMYGNDYDKFGLVSILFLVRVVVLSMRGYIHAFCIFYVKVLVGTDYLSATDWLCCFLLWDPRDSKKALGSGSNEGVGETDTVSPEWEISANDVEVNQFNLSVSIPMASVKESASVR